MTDHSGVDLSGRVAEMASAVDWYALPFDPTGHDLPTVTRNILFERVAPRVGEVLPCGGVIVDYDEATGYMVEMHVYPVPPPSE